mgnify:CR=1 FL=1
MLSAAPWSPPSRTAPAGKALRRRDGAKERSVRATGTGMYREPGPEDASSEGMRLKSNRSGFDLRLVGLIGAGFFGDFLCPPKESHLPCGRGNPLFQIRIFRLIACRFIGTTAEQEFLHFLL